MARSCKGILELCHIIFFASDLYGTWSCEKVIFMLT